MANGFFKDLTAVKVDKAVTTKDKLQDDLLLQKMAVQAKLKDLPFKPTDSPRAFHEWLFLRGGTGGRISKRATSPSLSMGAIPSRSDASSSR
jgi:hypothetical protein